MDKKKVPVNAYLIIACIFLALLYSLSPFKRPSVEKRKAVKTSLVNPKYLNEISLIQISSKASAIVFQKNNDFWEIVDFENPAVKLPAESERINKMINDFVQIRDAFQVSKAVDKKDSLTAENFGLEEDAVEITFSTRNNELSSIKFGKNDFTQTMRYIKSGNSQLVYEIEDFAADYLTTSVQAWSEPFIISQQVLGKIKAADIQRIITPVKTYTNTDEAYNTYVSKLLELRHGDIDAAADYNSFSEIYNLIIEAGNKDSINIKVSESSKEGQYLLEISYFDENTQNTTSYYETISSWTFSKLKYEQN